MATGALAAHPPAVKIGGRRLSVTSKPKPHIPTEPAPVEPSTPTDYPRPVHSEDQVQAPPPPPHHEDEVPHRKDKKHSSHENERLLRDLAQRKLEPTRPNKDLLGHKSYGGAGRIAQPAGKPLSV